MPLRGWIVPVGDAIPDRREAALRGTHSQAALGNDKKIFRIAPVWRYNSRFAIANFHTNPIPQKYQPHVIC